MSSAAADRRRVCELLTQRDAAITAWRLLPAGHPARTRAQSRLAMLQRKLSQLPAPSCKCKHRPMPESLARRPPARPLAYRERVLQSQT